MDGERNSNCNDMKKRRTMRETVKQIQRITTHTYARPHIINT